MDETIKEQKINKATECGIIDITYNNSIFNVKDVEKIIDVITATDEIINNEINKERKTFPR
jgi:hypothetical protein